MRIAYMPAATPSNQESCTPNSLQQHGTNIHSWQATQWLRAAAGA
jgi:hypothetical protein